MSTHATLMLDKWDEGHIPTCMLNNKTSKLSCVLALPHLDGDQPTKC